MIKKLAFFIENMISNYQRTVIQAVADTAREMEYELHIFTGFGTYGENYIHIEGERNIINLPYLEDYAGVILAPDTYNSEKVYEELADKVQKEAKCPIVCLRCEDKRFYNVLIDDYSATVDAVEHYIIVHNFKKICFMTGRMELQDARIRLKAYRDTMEKYNYPVTEHMIFEGNYWKDKGKEAVDWFLGDGEFPEAIVCSNDYMAISVCEELRKRGYQVPRDIRVTGFDNINEAKYFDPPIASVDVPFGDMGRMAVQLIDRIVNGYDVEQTTYVPVKSHFEGTCGCGKGFREQQIAELYNRNEYLKHTISQILYMNVELDICNTMEEVFQTGFPYSYNFAYDTIYICLCHGNDDETNLDETSLEQYTESMCLRAIMSMDDGLIACEEVFSRREILPQKYKDKDAVIHIIPLHAKNKSLGYLVFQAKSIDELNEIFRAWIMLTESSVNKVQIYMENLNLASFKEQAHVDDLTGLYNRRMFEKIIKMKAQKSLTEKLSFCLVNIDMDGLKYINDTFGHVQGDRALRAFADILKEISNEVVIASRMGGDEFALCIDASDAEEVQAIIDDINDKIKEYNCRSKNPYQLSASIGYAFYQKSKGLIACMKRADENMYAEKAKKKQNRK